MRPASAWVFPDGRIQLLIGNGGQQAEKLRAAAGGFSFFSRKEDKLQDAAELYVQAANAFRLQKNCKNTTATWVL